MSSTIAFIRQATACNLLLREMEHAAFHAQLHRDYADYLPRWKDRAQAREHRQAAEYWPTQLDALEQAANVSATPPRSLMELSSRA